jgi:hypothetical protein
MRYVIGLIVIAFGVVVVIKTDWFYAMTGALDWPETHIGPGGTRIFLKIVGIVIIFAAFLYMSGALGDLGHAVLTPTVPAPQ